MLAWLSTPSFWSIRYCKFELLVFIKNTLFHIHSFSKGGNTIQVEICLLNLAITFSSCIIFFLLFSLFNFQFWGGFLALLIYIYISYFSYKFLYNFFFLFPFFLFSWGQGLGGLEEGFLRPSIPVTHPLYTPAYLLNAKPHSHQDQMNSEGSWVDPSGQVPGSRVWDLCRESSQDRPWQGD